MSIEQMRQTYTMAGLHERDVDSDPLVQFQTWFDEAQQPDLPDWVEINAMTLATTDPGGHVTSRIVLLKGIERGRMCFYTNYDSAKGRQMASNPRASLCFYWPHLQRQVRVVGNVSKTTPAESEKYFRTRPRDHQLGAHVSRQSAVIADRSELQQRMDQLQKEYSEGDIPCPEHWGGYGLTPDEFEFWQGRPSRLHDRLRYRRAGSTWQLDRLAP